MDLSKSEIQSPLIPNGVEYDANLVKKCHEKAEIVTELKRQMSLAGPLIAVNLFQSSLRLISVMFVGHLDELSLASASLATSFAGVTGFSLLLGMGQAYGARQYHMLGVQTQRAMLVLALMSIPISILWVYSGHIFMFFGQDAEISSCAEIYALWLIPSILPYGAALSIAISYWINVFILAIYIKMSPRCEKTWIGFSKEGMANLVDFIKLGIPSALMICLWWTGGSLIVHVAFAPNPKLETSMMSISLNTSSLVFKIPLGLGSAISTRVSNELGAGKPQSARLAVQIVICLAVIESVLLDIWGYLFTNEVEVVRYFASIMPILAISNFTDGIQGVLSGSARGCGLQKIGAYINIGAYYLVGIPCAIVLAFVFHFGGKGLWMGIIFGSSLQALLLLVITMCTNWETQAKKARDRLYASSISEHNK